MKKIGFIAPWYGETIPGGAEMELRGLIHHLQDAGIPVEVLTTCIHDFMCNWNDNYYRPGNYQEAGIPIRRFPVRHGNHDIFGRINQKLLNNMSVTPAEERAFIEESVRSCALEAYIREKQEDYSLFVYIPYMFGTTYYGVLACPEKAVMIPCLHDENYAYMKIYQKCFKSAKGIIFHAESECLLAKKLYRLERGNYAVLGEGVNTDIHGDAERFRKKYHISGSFLLYAGRKDKTKNVDLLLRYFQMYQRRNEPAPELVMIGPAELEIPEEIKTSVHDLGFVPIQDKYDAYAAAAALCQPSKNESFSLVIMESWLCGRPVLVSEECAVTAGFARQSNGGFCFKDYYQFEAQLTFLLEHPEEAAKLGKQGGAFVRQNFAWNVIVENYLKFFQTCME